jgi:hypothetical protein
MIAKHSNDGSHFLGLRQGRAGGYEIVYEATKTGKRLIWKINSNTVSEGDIMRELESALETSSVLDTLRVGLRSAHIAFEVDVAPKFGNRHFG